MALDDIEYLRLRAREERQRAVASPDHAIGKVHADFARQYEAEAERLHADEQLRTSRIALDRSQRLLEITSKQVAANKAHIAGGIAAEEL